MSHEIRTPLTAIIGNLELLSHSSQSTQPERLETIRRSSESLLAIVSDVLDFSKIEADQLRVERVEFDALEVALTSLEIFTPMARAKGLVMRGELSDSATVSLRGDPTRLGQILNNLLSNAIKFTEEGQITLRIINDQDKGELSFEVEDTGIGMTEIQVLQAFDAFSQADESVYRRFGGTGLGLTLCMRLTKAMGGRLSVRSAPGLGSSFRLVLRMDTGDGVADRPYFNDKHVLFLASRADDRAYLQHVLHVWGIRAVGYLDPTQIDDEVLACADGLILWEDDAKWNPEDENRLVEQAQWVIECTAEGPRDPVARGRLLATSNLGVYGLSHALRYVFQEHVLPVREQQHLVLPKQLRVLVAEDNPVIRQMFEEQLGLLGCLVEVVEDGRQALASLERERFDVLLTDLSMPEMDGYQLSRQSCARWPSMPVVAVTAAATVQEHEACEAAGITLVLVKPIPLVRLAKALREVLGTVLTEPFSEQAPSIKQNDQLSGAPIPANLQATFNSFCVTSFAAIRDAFEVHDEQRLLFELHSLKGALGVYRMPAASRKVAAVEARLKNGEKDALSFVEPLLQELQRTLMKRV